VPATWPHILAFPLHISLMTRRDFPFALLGLVHIANRIRVFKPVRLGDELTLTCRFGKLEAHDKGRAFSILTDAHVHGEKVWEDESVMLARGKSEGTPAATAKAAEIPASQAAEEIWKLPANLGFRYAGASGDFNPIHIHAVTARLFGFKQAIAHGMWTKAKSLATLDSRIAARPFEIDVQFKLPVFLPTEVQFYTSTANDGFLFAVRDAKGEKPHLAGRITLF
jgi:acyl dehydratase